MAIRFRKSKKIAPGVRLNINKNSIGISAGVRGARVSVNSNGRVTKSVGIPGTGLYSVEATQMNKTTRTNNQQAESNTRKRSGGSKVGLLVLIVLAAIMAFAGLGGLSQKDYLGGGVCIALCVLFAVFARRVDQKMQQGKDQSID